MKYVGAIVGPAGTGQRNQLQILQAKRAGMVAAMTSMQSRLNTVTNMFAQTQIDRVTGEATNAARAGVSRIEEMTKAANEARNKRIDDAQQQLASVQSKVNKVA